MKIVSLFLLFIPYSFFAQIIEAEYAIKSIKANTKYSDYGTSYFGPNKIVFASTKLSKKRFRNEEKKAPLYDLFEGFLNLNGEINYVKRIKNNFSTRYNESNVSFTPDLKYVYFTQNNTKNGKYIKDKHDWVNLKIFRAHVKANGEWTNIISLPFNANSYSCAHPSVSEDGRILFFTSDMPGSIGQSDIYWVTISKDGKYGKPTNLGTHVNSISKENFPFIDGNILYFSSDRIDSKGGLDVYMVEIDNLNSKPTNLGFPINSSSDDFCFVINRENKTGFLSSNRANGKGEDDIYTFVQKTKVVSCEQLVTGQIRDLETNKIIPEVMVSLFSHKNILLATFPTRKDGTFKFKLACRGNYRIEAAKLQYEQTSKEINYIPKTQAQETTLFLKRIQKQEVVAIEKTKNIEKETADPSIINRNKKLMLNLEPIYFILDEYYITKSSDKALAKAADLINNYPNIIIEIGSHTDCRASDSYNLHLSNLRAKEVVRYLVNLGVSKHKLRGRGYGESKLVNHCSDGVKCKEVEHLQNRRTEFVIIQK